MTDPQSAHWAGRQAVTGPHLNGWGCLAAILLIREARGVVAPFAIDCMITAGGRVIAGGPGTYLLLLQMSDSAFGVD